jgi:chromosome segregation ATPase
VADEQAALAVGSGRLTRALAYSGFGDVDVTAATATPIRSAPSARASGPARSRRKARPEPGTGRSSAGEEDGEEDGEGADEDGDTGEAERRQRQAERLQAADEAQQAADDLAAARSDLAAAQQRRDEAREEETRLTGRLEELQAEVLETRHQLDALGRTIAAATREQGRRERQVKDADRDARRATEALHRLDGD